MLSANRGPIVVRASAVLTNSYVAGTVISGEDTSMYRNMKILLNFTKGSLTTAEIKVEFSWDGTNYYQETAESTSGGVITRTVAYHQLSATGLYWLSFTNVCAPYIKISVQGTGTVTNSLITVDAVLFNDVAFSF